MQLAQLLLAHLGGRIGHLVRSGLRLRERNHIADAVRARHQHGEAVQAERDSPVRGRTELQRIEQEAEFLTSGLGADAEQLEHRRLQFLVGLENQRDSRRPVSPQGELPLLVPAAPRVTPEDEAARALSAAVEALNPDELSPKAALEALYRLRGLLKR